MSRKRRTKADWEVLLSKQKESRQGVKEWCTTNGINVNSMYNQIAKKHKEQAKVNTKWMTKANEPDDTDTKSSVAKPEPIEWKEIKIIPEQQRDTAIQRSSVYIEIGGMRLAADAGYPVINLAALCKELLQTC